MGGLNGGRCRQHQEKSGIGQQGHHAGLAGPASRQSGQQEGSPHRHDPARHDELHGERGAVMRDRDPAQGGGEDIGQRSPEADPAIVETAGRRRGYREAVGQRPHGGEDETERQAEQEQPAEALDDEEEGEAQQARQREQDQRPARLAPGIGGAGDQRIADEARDLDGAQQIADLRRRHSLAREIARQEGDVDPEGREEGGIEEREAQGHGDRSQRDEVR